MEGAHDLNGSAADDRDEEVKGSEGHHEEESKDTVVQLKLFTCF